MGPKGKCPWLTDDDGKAIADSQFIIEHLTKKHKIEVHSKCAIWYNFWAMLTF
jgi:glutathione S-transferase